MSVFIKCGHIRLIYVSVYKMRAYQTAGRGGGAPESAVKWSGKNEFKSGKSQ